MDWLLEVGKQVPALVVLGWIVRTFLIHLERRDDALGGIAEACHIVQRDAIECMHENTRVIGEVTEALRRGSSGSS